MYPSLFQEIFVTYQGQRALEADEILEIYKNVDFAEEGSNLKAVQEKAVAFWRDFVLECEGSFR